ncbi:MobF family relaxase [Brachybacterium sp. J153]|uniref:MobF family relaxase n=1 Tax=Brachybacterium sp. J153 TaxID=3116488 RepID=UPI002E7A41FD|nr:MobF family relaxase [Brachybacterium sp. J153]MEE1616988.1 MobF family relaxase [Brachybacterium sp. J153]
MRGGVQVWRRGVDGHGIRHATAYALQGGCDAAEVERQVSAGADAAAAYGPDDAPTVVRHTARADGIQRDRLDAEQLRAWIDGVDPETGEQRGRTMTSPDAHLLYDATINAPKSYSLAAVLHPELREEFDALMDRVTEETVTAWSEELTTRRGAGGKQRIGLAQVEVVTLDHERSRSLDPHAHRHLWLNAKVQGADGKWSNVDSQQVFRHQVLVNARGELAARTDARWRAALASHGYTLNDEGEIAELSHVVDPMSKRAAQIGRNKARFEREWRAANPGQEPSPRLIESWDRQAWALDRAPKPDELDEDQWRDQVRREIADVDPAVLVARPPAPVQPREAHEVDRDQLTAYALGWTDQRAVRSQGRFSRVDLRAGATMAVAQAQLTVAPEELHRLIGEVETRALLEVESLAPAGVRGPEDVKALRLTAVGEARARITERAAVRAAIGDPTPAPVEAIAAAVAVVDAERAAAGDDPVQLDDRQIAAARAVAGSSPLVTIEGPAGAGKTTMLTVAERAIAAEGHRMLTVAPTMKAAQVAQAEIGADGSSLHALLYQHGFRWRTAASGQTTWQRLASGDTDTDGSIYYGPSAAAQLASGDVIVCDEAGMVDVDAMAALLTVADDTGARLALVGDPHQVRPVGHSGAMALVQAQVPEDARVDLHSIHRFRRADDPRQADTAYAEISRDMRAAATPAKAHEVALWLHEHGHVDRLSDTAAQTEQAAAAWLTAHGAGESIAVLATNNETVDAINTAIQEARIEAGQLDTTTTAAGRDGAVLHIGDVVTTRRNHRGEDFTVANREVWTVRDVAEDGTVTLSGGIDQRTEQIPADYAAASVALGYASTIHGAQGVTARRAVTVVSEDTTAAQLYVGMTRGKLENRALVAGADDTAVLTQLSDAMLRERNDLTDEQLRQLVARDLDRAGTAAEAEPARDAEAWRQRPYGDLPDPGVVYDRLTRRRDRLTATVRSDESRRHTLAEKISVELEPAVAVARRDQADALTIRTAEKRHEIAQRQLDEVDARLEKSRTQLGRIDHHLSGLAEEIETRTVMDPELARTEQHAREHAAIYEPAKPTDSLRRPFGLAPSLATEHVRIRAERDEARMTIARASAEQNSAGAHTADMRREAEQAAAAGRAAQQQMDAAAEEATRQHATTLRAELTALQQAREAAASAGMLRRRGAQRTAVEVEERFIAAHGTVPEETAAETWVQATAAEAAHHAVSAAGLPGRVEQATAQAARAQSEVEKADRTEVSLAQSIHTARLDLTDLDAQENELRQEAKVRREMPEEPAAKENRQRQARARQSTPTPAPARTAQPQRPIQDEDAQRPARPLR